MYGFRPSLKYNNAVRVIERHSLMNAGVIGNIYTSQ